MARRNWSPGPNLAADQLLRDRPPWIIHTNVSVYYPCRPLLRTANVAELPQCLFQHTSCVKAQRHRSFVTSHSAKTGINYIYFYYRCHARPRVRSRVRDHGDSRAEGSTLESINVCFIASFAFSSSGER